MMDMFSLVAFEGHTPDNVKEKRLTDIYRDSGYICKVREKLEEYYKGEVSEPCFGQDCRNR